MTFYDMIPTLSALGAIAMLLMASSWVKATLKAYLKAGA